MREDLARNRRSRARGVSLVEITGALALVSVILLSGLSLLVLQPRIQERTRAGEAALHAIEAALETLRAEELPLSGGLLVPGDAYPINDSAPDLRMTLEVEPLDVPGLYELEFVATWAMRGRTTSRELKTLVWRP